MNEHIFKTISSESLVTTEGGEGLQIWSVSENVLDRQLWTADVGWPSSFDVGRG